MKFGLAYTLLAIVLGSQGLGMAWNAWTPSTKNLGVLSMLLSIGLFKG